MLGGGTVMVVCLSVLIVLFPFLCIRLELHSISGEVCPGNHLAGLNPAIAWLATYTRQKRHASALG